MEKQKAIAIVGAGAIVPDAPDVTTFWQNVKSARYSIDNVPSNRWHVDYYFDPDPQAPDKTYTKIGGWVREFKFEPLKWGIPIPPRMIQTMDEAQQWAIAAARQALQDYGYPDKRSLDPTRVAVILGNAMAGEKHYLSSLRIRLPEYVAALSATPVFHQLPQEVQIELLRSMQDEIWANTPEITEDTMPGELSNVIAGRVANVFNFSGPNFVTDAACASSLAALQAAVDGLNSYQYDAALSGGVDRNMGVESFVKFCKIGALSPDGSRPYADGANGFVMGEGAVIYLLKRLEDAERDGDHIYAVIRGIGSSSDGKGKGITAPNPIGQQRAIERAWKDAGVSPASAGLIEGHGTSTRVGDVTEVNSLNAIFGGQGIPAGTIALGSVKSNIGHLKSAAGAVGMLKTAMALHDKLLPPSTNFQRPNPNIDFPHLPFFVNTEARDWPKPAGEIRRAAVSSFGFGGTNFHVVLEEHVPGLLTSKSRSFAAVQPHTVAAPAPTMQAPEPTVAEAANSALKPYRGILFLSAGSKNELKQRLMDTLEAVRQGTLPPSALPAASELSKPERLAIDYDGVDELIKRAEKCLKTFEMDTPAAWQALTAQGVYVGSGAPGKVAFLFPGQGSQYVNMLREFAEIEPVIAETFQEADRVMTPILGRSLTSYIFSDGSEETLKQAEAALRDTTITQPAVLTANVALLRLMAKYGYAPDLVIGHSLGEYAALVAAGVLSFSEALEVVSARGREMSKISVADNGCMAAVSAPIELVENTLKTVDDYVVIANINSPLQSVIAGTTSGIEKSIAAFMTAGYQATKIPVSHAFHTKIVAPASGPLRKVIERMNLQAPRIPVVANVTGKLYPSGREEILQMLADQVASPVQFIQGVHTLFDEGVRVFVEVGPKRVLNALASDILKDQPGITILATNHPRKGALPSFNEALCGLLAAGVVSQASKQPAAQPAAGAAAVQQIFTAPTVEISDGRLPLTGSVVVSGAGLGLPGRSRNVFNDDNVQRLLKGEQCIEPIPLEVQQEMVDRRVIRLEKSDAGAQMVEIDSTEQAVKLAGQSGAFDVKQEFGVPAERVDAWDIATQLAVAAGIDALRDAGIPLVMTFRQTSKGTYLPNRWMLPEALADETGVIFASAFPGVNRMAEETDRFYHHKNLKSQVDELRKIKESLPADQAGAQSVLAARISELEKQLAEFDYHFDRRFIFRILAMGHSQFAEYIGARGPNTYVNAACATTTHAVAVAEDWVRTGRCRRVIVISGDDVTDGNLVNWISTGLLASGATSTERNLRLAALPFDKRRNGLIPGMGAAALVVEAEDAVRERGMRGICELLASQIANSAYHGTRLDIQHVSDVMDRVVCQAEQRFGIRRQEIAPKTVFVSHETYTPARGGSASAEIFALRKTFGDVASKIVIANTKGFTGHTMGVGIEDVMAVKALQFSQVPPIAHLDQDFQPDPDLGDLNLSRGGSYPVQYALRLGAGFGSQIAMTLMRQIPGVGERVEKDKYQRWLSSIAGYETADLEVVQRTLRIKNAGPPAIRPATTRWQFGQGPTLWAATPDGSEKRAASVPAPIQAPKADVVEAVRPAQPVSVPAPVVAAAPAPAAVDDEAIRQFVLAAVSEKTGYPPEMLDLDLDLEGDLGVDTVKQAELFATIREHYGIARRADLRLSDYNTLAKVIQFMKDAVPAQAQAPAAVSAAPAVQAAPVSTPVADDGSIKDFVVSLVSEKTGYPAEMLDLDLDLEGDLGIDTVKQAELFAAVRENYGIPRRPDLRLSDYNTLTKVIGFVKEAQGAGQAASPVQPAVQSQPVSMAAPAVEPVAQPAPASSQTVDAGAGEAQIKDYVLGVVSEKTGYPVEMLDLELDLEGDLGVDTVKQAELFATIRTHYGIPRREDLRLSDYNTLEKVIQFMKDALPAQVAPVAAPAPVEHAAVVVAQAAPAVEAGQREEIKQRVLAMVSEKTGYPQEMLDLELDLEGDLGIDTVKQAELFAGIRTSYGIPRREDLRLSDYNTLEKVIGFVLDSLPQEAAPAVEQTAPIVVEQVQPAAEQVSEPPVETQAAPVAAAAAVTDVEPEQAETTIRRRVPAAVLRPRLDLCKPTQVSLTAESRIVVVQDGGKVGESLVRRLRARKVQVLSINGLSPAETAEKVKVWAADGPVQGVYFLRGLDVEAPLTQMDAELWQQSLESRVYTLEAILRVLAEPQFLICATRMGGLHGFAGQLASPLAGSISGLAKAIGMERPETLVKVVDFSEQETATNVASRLIEETLKDPAVVEVGWEGSQRFTITLQHQVAASEPLSLEAGAVFLVSGGSGGITAPIVTDLARRTHGTFYLASRTPLPDRADPDLARLQSDRNGLKQDLMKRLSEGGKKATPAKVEQHIAALERGAATLATIDAVEQAGGKAIYLTCDISDPVSVQTLLANVRKAEGRLDVLVHAAGQERSRKLESKPESEFRQVLDVKATGFFNLIKACESAQLLPKAMIAFASVAGRFGNTGQTDYSAANDLLSKLVMVVPQLYPGVKATVIDWGAWAEVGMASRGHIPELMRMAGIEMMSPAQAAPLVYRELVSGAGGEVVLSGALGALEQQRDPDGGMDVALANVALTEGRPIHVMLSRATGFNLQEGILLEAELDPNEEPFLKDHAMNGIPLLPGVMGIEGFSVAAQHVSSVLGSEKGGFRVANLKDICFNAPFKFYRNEPRRITWKAQVVREAEGLVAHVILESTLALKSRPDEIMRHFSGKVALVPVQEEMDEQMVQPPVWNGAYTLQPDDIYKLYFHGPAFQVLDGVQRAGDSMLGKLRKDLPSITAGGQALLSTPVLVELCLQTAGVWEVGSTGVLGLPHSIGQLKLYRTKTNGIPIFAEVFPIEGEDGRLQFDARVVDAKGHLYLELKDYRTAPLPYAVENELVEPLKALMKG